MPDEFADAANITEELNSNNFNGIIGEYEASECTEPAQQTTSRLELQ
jgi:hypothetical protein